MDFLKSFQQFPEKYKRIISNGSYSPKADAIRFVAIISVILCHIHSYTSYKNSYQIHVIDFEERWIYNLFQGICLFFVLSGYILSNAFFQARNSNQKISLKNYYWRRVTRLEPAYFITLIFSFLVFIFVLKKISFDELLPHFLASCFYLNNIIYPHTHPMVLQIAWTLEVEVQFYLLLPFLFFLYTKNLKLARIISLLIIFLIPFSGFKNPINFHTTLFYQLPYFLAGMLLADVLNNEKKWMEKLSIPKTRSMLLAVVCVGLMWGINWYDYPTYFRPDVMPIVIFVFYFLIFTQNIFANFFTNRWVALIGGMCYSLYLTHYIIISFVGKYSVQLKVSEYYLLNYALQILLLLPIILIGGFLFYRFIELPTMNKDWVKNLIAKLK